jgi:hypothetical protein
MTPHKPRRFAEGTTVDAAKSRQAIDNLLSQYGCGQRAIAHDDASMRAIVTFRFKDRFLKLEVKLKPPPRKDPKQFEREAWRRMLLLLKAKFEAIAEGSSTFEGEFLAAVMLPDGRTVADEVRGAIEQAYTTGQVSRLLPALGGT